MHIVFNGEPKEIEANTSLAELLVAMNLAPRPIAVELNLQVIPREGQASIVLRPGDKLEVVTLAGGG